MRGHRALMGALVVVSVLLPLLFFRSHLVAGRPLLIAACSLSLAYVGGTALMLTARRDWASLRMFLFAFRRGIFGAPNAFWAALALAALVRVLWHP